MEKISITECPRDAMQGIKEFIPTELKTQYINQLLKCNFDILDFGSFVSPKAIPQLHDTATVLNSLNLDGINTKLLAIIANYRGGEDAVKFDEITYLGFPFSVSETFQKRNTNSSIEESLSTVEKLQELCVKNNKNLLVYLSMAFGNPYGDEWNPQIVVDWAGKISKLGIKHIALADTVGSSTVESINNLFSNVIPELKDVVVNAHLHSTPEAAMEKVQAAYNSGCRNFDVAIKGFGGCPMATDNLTGNMATETLLQFIHQHKLVEGVDHDEFLKAQRIADEVFAYH